ncbi:hypothetical protein BGZ70_003074 [Mortierella alpina]|uniref:Uncharacterized protein n=1 Tax=Mortierella alpina TaxID=64518 RepID=A0A9P6JEI3_MORAP|nr:hypothetical protein BGZ70_003074 [Mortierella alpina]
MSSTHDRQEQQEQKQEQQQEQMVRRSSSSSEPPSAARVRPSSVSIDLSEAMSKPPAYDHGGASPASRQESGHRSSIQFQPPSASRQLTPSSGATPPQSQSAYRRPFLEEDELPEYITLSEAGPPFKIPASRSTTYTVTPIQGPVEFQQTSVSVLQPATSPRPPLTRSQHPVSSLQTTPSTIGPHEGSHGQQGAWTLEYWVDDTLTYLCYLMDPKLSATTALVPRNLADNVGSSQNRVSSVAEIAQPAAQALQSSPSNVSRATRSSHNETGSSNVGRVEVTIHNNAAVQDDNLSNEPSDQDGLERVPTGHIRGRPPPLNRSRNAATSTFMSAEQAANDIDTMWLAAGHHRNMGAVVVRVPRAGPAVASPTSEPVPEPVPEPTATIQVDTVDSAPEELNDEAGPAHLQPVESADTVAHPLDERVSTERAFGALPPVHHVRINDGYAGEEADTMLAHAMDLQPMDGDRAGLPSIHSNAFNNALTSEFFKSPTFAFVSAEDPQTWIWWSSHHESNLQRCRQEGPYEERVKGGPVAEIWIHEGGALEAQDPIDDPLATIPTYQSVMGPALGESSEGSAGGEFGAGVATTATGTGTGTITGTGAGSGAMEGNEPASFIRSGSSSVISNNGTTANTFMTDVSAFTGGPVRSTIASTFNHPAASDRPSSAPSLVERASVSSRRSTRPAGSVREADSSSSFPSKLRQRQCVIRVMQGLNSEVETFALSTGPRLPELFDLYTDQSLPGPSRKAFVCALTTFGILVVIAFTSIAFVSR